MTKIYILIQQLFVTFCEEGKTIPTENKEMKRINVTDSECHNTTYTHRFSPLGTEQRSRISLTKV